MAFKKTPRFWFWLSLALLSCMPLFAAEYKVPVEPTPELKTLESGPWSSHRMGFYFGTLGDPAPSLGSFNVAYHLNDSFRVHAGIGWIPLIIDSATSYGAGILYRPRAQSQWSPVIGLAGTAVRVKWDKLSGFASELFKTKMPVIDETFYVGVAKLGMDLQVPSGFNLGFGLQLLVAEIQLPCPYLHLGWFF